MIFKPDPKRLKQAQERLKQRKCERTMEHFWEDLRLYYEFQDIREYTNEVMRRLEEGEDVSEMLKPLEDK